MLLGMLSSDSRKHLILMIECTKYCNNSSSNIVLEHSNRVLYAWLSSWWLKFTAWIIKVTWCTYAHKHLHAYTHTHNHVHTWMSLVTLCLHPAVNTSVGKCKLLSVCSTVPPWPDHTEGEYMCRRLLMYSTANFIVLLSGQTWFDRGVIVWGSVRGVIVWGVWSCEGEQQVHTCEYLLLVLHHTLCTRYCGVVFVEPPDLSISYISCRCFCNFRCHFLCTIHIVWFLIDLTAIIYAD